MGNSKIVTCKVARILIKPVELKEIEKIKDMHRQQMELMEHVLGLEAIKQVSVKIWNFKCSISYEFLSFLTNKYILIYLVFPL